ncbi:hypothetical protein NMY22_g2560 [Coprinellus aureogranulatus]|nr:hypothetical protein NMY22_g2560 [Coprinellus aureogranulatus]
MPPSTSTEIIDIGRYLEATFDPATLTISQLLGVLAYHEVQYPTPYSKTKLVEAFNRGIKSNRAALKAERSLLRQCVAKGDDIIDGKTGKSLGWRVPGHVVPLHPPTHPTSPLRPPTESKDNDVADVEMIDMELVLESDMEILHALGERLSPQRVSTDDRDRHFGPPSARARFSPQRLVTPPPSSRRQTFPMVDFRPVPDVVGQVEIARKSDSSTPLSVEVQMYTALLVRRKLLRRTTWVRQENKSIDAIVKDVLERYPALRITLQDIREVIKQEHETWRREKLPTQRSIVKAATRGGKTAKMKVQPSFRGSPPSDDSASPSFSASSD